MLTKEEIELTLGVLSWGLHLDIRCPISTLIYIALKFREVRMMQIHFRVSNLFSLIFNVDALSMVFLVC